MRHVDDGALNALLDGALNPDEAAALRGHLLLCTDCRRRLDDARVLRDQAEALLGSAALELAGPPPFEEILLRAAAAGAVGTAPQLPLRGRIGYSPALKFAWAATVVLALVGGWWARELTRSAGRAQAPQPRLAAAAPATRAAPAAATPAPRPSADAAPAGGPAPRPEARVPRAAAPRGEPAPAAAPVEVAATEAAAMPPVEVQPAAGQLAGEVRSLTAGVPAARSPTSPLLLDRQAQAARSRLLANRAEPHEPIMPTPLAARDDLVVVPAAPAPRDTGSAPRTLEGARAAIFGEASNYRLLVSAESAGNTPTFTPHTVEPLLLNREEVRRILTRLYPPGLRDTGTSATTVVWILVDEKGGILRTQVKTSSGYPSVDRAALAVAGVMRFTPGLNRDEPVKVWVSVPLTFRNTE